MIITAQINGLILDKRSGGAPPHPRCDWGSRNPKFPKISDYGVTATINVRNENKTKVKINFIKWFSKTFPKSFGGWATWPDEFDMVGRFVRFGVVWIGAWVDGVEQISDFLKLIRLLGWINDAWSGISLSLIRKNRNKSFKSVKSLSPLVHLNSSHSKKTNNWPRRTNNKKRRKVKISKKKSYKIKSASENKIEGVGDSATVREKNGVSVVMKFYVVTKIMISLTIYLLLLCQSVERNPGPKTGAPSMSILTFNTNGLRDKLKLKRLLMKINPIIDKGGIALLQETHIVDTGYLKSIWKNKFSSNGVSTNSAGVITLFNNDFEILEEFSDHEGRQLIIAIKKEDCKYIVVNTYYPNDHRTSLKFANDLYEQILRIQQNYPEFEVIYTGDLNTCLSNEDCMNRNRSKTEELLSTLISENNRVIEVVDAYRCIRPNDGYTWKRGDCYSRLDYVFLSKSLTSKITKVKIDWAFDTSDHAALEVELKVDVTPKKGPGLIKINTTILEDPNLTKQIGEEIELMMTQIDNNWDPHLRLEFLKVCIRSAIASKVMENRKFMRRDILDCEEEINQIEDLKINILKMKKVNPMENSNICSIDTATNKLRNKLQNLRKDLSNAMSFVSRAKWFEYGEKSNKFFLNLNKSRQRQKLISSIRCNGKEHHGQADVSECVKSFYQKLYSKYPNPEEDENNFYRFCPKLSVPDQDFMDERLTMAQLEKALYSCKDSAPGPDGIPYLVYKKFWNITGKVILEAWNYSLESGKLTASHRESIITLLPKDGKDKMDIKNWRPITLSNCDSKIITKALAMKMSKILDSIIDPSQTAYVPGRSVADNLRSNFFLKEYCRKENKNSVLLSLDAKKAFDSVDHEYITRTLKAYGFGPAFITTFQILYKDISARILVNGFTTDSIPILRGVKQGDALSCSIFIICIDPLLRNINKNKLIKNIKVKGKNDICFKAAAYADDVSVVCGDDGESIQQVFVEYERLTKRSGLELNADKTEMLMLNTIDRRVMHFEYNDEQFQITTVNKLKICGLYFCSSLESEYEHNVLEKITMLSNKIRAWSHRHLTMEGKSLIVKTFGLSQMIYNMQTYRIKSEDLINVERIIFKFLWSNSELQNGVDRIKRSIMKNDYSKGGMCITDVDCLNKSLKLKQFIRASNSKHAISKIQTFLTGSVFIRNEYNKVIQHEAVSEIAMETVNILADHNRSSYINLTSEEYENDRLLINDVASINLATYFKRRKEALVSCMLLKLTKSGIQTLADLTQSYEYEQDRNKCRTMEIIMKYIPIKLIEITRCFNEDINSDEGKLEYIKNSTNSWYNINDLSVKELQKMLKIATKKVESLIVKEKLNINEFDDNNVIRFRSMCKNPKMRNIYFRLIHNDFFTHSRMKRYKMTMNDKCPRCDKVEDTRHMLWDCTQARNIWNKYNNLVRKVNIAEEATLNYEQIFTPGKNPAMCMIKIKIIQELIQIERPKNWTDENINKICDDLLKTERYNAMVSRTIPKFQVKWKMILNM